MHFYEVGLSDRGLKQHQSLTYSSVTALRRGDIVRIPIRNKLKNGVVLGEVSKPEYKTKPIESILDESAIPEHLLALSEWIAGYYAVDLGSTLGLIIPRGADKKRRELKQSKSRDAADKDSTSPLTNEQTAALEAINKKPATYLLHGETGSGKSRVYIELTKKARAQGKGVIMLVPEIGLTSQMIDETVAHIGHDELFVVHSHQTEAERHAQWKAIKIAEHPVVIGPRSALFSPIANLGLIIVDEEHETSYKQDISPKYDAIRVASKLRAITGSTLVLGSATPSVQDYALAGKENIVRMSSTVKPLHKTDITVIDNTNRDHFSRDRWISTPLIESISESIKSGNQAMIFHNRRGTSTSVLCESCAYVATCPNCELPLTHHADWAKLVCHTCAHSEQVFTSCPDCRSTELVYKGAGTKEIETSLRKLFPNATIERFDSDITAKEDQLEQRYTALVNGEVDIIIGTQMVAKGLDLPKLSTVGVVNSDMALYLPDFSSSERSYQLIRQVIGRAGRHQNGNVYLQTYNPKSPSLGFAIDKNWDDFYEGEMEARRRTGYPPHSFLLKMTYEGRTSEEGRTEAQRLLSAVKKLANVKVLGPTPSFHHKTKNGWRWQIVAKADNRAKLVNIAKQLPPDWQFDLDPINLL